MKIIRGILAGCAAALAMTAGAQTAQNYPTQPVKIVVPFPPGGGTDTVSRILLDPLGRKLGHQFVMDYKPGGNTVIGTNAFQVCSALTTLTLPPGLTGSIGAYAFYYCTALTSLVIQSPTRMTLANVNAFTNTTCDIYVPDALVATYQAATNWSTLAARIKPTSELP